MEAAGENGDVLRLVGTENVSYLWNFNGRNWRQYMDSQDFSQAGGILHSTGKFRFSSGFLDSATHHVQGYITRPDCSMYIKIYLEDIKPSPNSEFNTYKLWCPPKVRRTLCPPRDTEDPGRKLSKEVKKRLIAERFFTENDFTAGPNAAVYWFFWCDNAEECLNKKLSLFNGPAIPMNFKFSWFSWKKSSQPGGPTNANAVLPIDQYHLSPKFSDFAIQCGDKTFDTHRIVIASRSAVLAAMLEQPLQEMQEGRLIIVDFSPEVVEEFLRFFYTGKANVDKCAMELFKMAHKYEVIYLKAMCETALVSQVNEKNLADMNELGNLYNSEILKGKCYSFFKANLSSLIQTKSDVCKFSDFSLKFMLEYQ